MQDKKEILMLIDDYIGSEFRFLVKYLDGGFEHYVKENIEQRIFKSCQNCIEYVKNNT